MAPTSTPTLIRSSVSILHASLTTDHRNALTPLHCLGSLCDSYMRLRSMSGPFESRHALAAGLDCLADLWVRRGSLAHVFFQGQ